MRIEEKSTEKRRMASLEVGTCRRAENLKKKIMYAFLNFLNKGIDLDSSVTFKTEICCFQISLAPVCKIRIKYSTPHG